MICTYPLTISIMNHMLRIVSYLKKLSRIFLQNDRIFIIYRDFIHGIMRILAMRTNIIRRWDYILIILIQDYIFPSLNGLYLLWSFLINDLHWLIDRGVLILSILSNILRRNNSLCIILLLILLISLLLIDISWTLSIHYILMLISLMLMNTSSIHILFLIVTWLIFFLVLHLIKIRFIYSLMFTVTYFVRSIHIVTYTRSTVSLVVAWQLWS